MKKRYLLLTVLIILSALALTGCNKSGQTLAEYEKETAGKENEAASQGTGLVVVEHMSESGTEDKTEPETVQITVYRSNQDATGLEGQDVQLSDIKPESIMEELAKVMVVSQDTRVLDFSLTQDGKHITMDLSPEFSSYINMMGTTGEYLVVGAMVNTFLEAYGAEDILITTEGKTLETSHALYDKPLLKFETETDKKTDADATGKKPMAYRLKDTSYKQEEKELYYPQFDGMPDQDLQNTWNQAIADIVLSNPEKKENVVCDSYVVDYEIGYCSEDMVSFLFTGKARYGNETFKEKYALTFDFVSGTCVRFGDLSDAMETVSYNMANRGYYKIMNKDLDREAFDEYFKDSITDAAGYREGFLRYDYDLLNLSAKPEGFIYINGTGELEIIMNPVKDLSEEQIEICTGVMIK